MKKILFLVLPLFILLFTFSQDLHAQKKKKIKVISIGFYNLDNLFDTINDVGLENSDEFTPKGTNKWTSERYLEKLKNMAYVISQIAVDETPEGVALLGLSEMENRGVLEDLVKQEAIKDRDYQIVHYESSDRRGVDVALIYQPKYFKVTCSKAYPLRMAEDTSWRTRDQLVVSGLLDGEKIHVIVNHWPSRSGGVEASEPKRIAAGDLCRHIVDSLNKLDKNAKILVLGDLNDNPDNPSVEEHLRAKGNISQLEEGDFFNPMFKMYKDGIGSLEYKDIWDLFDQIILSQGFLGENKSNYKFDQSYVFNKNFLKQKEGDYAGYPLRTFAGEVYMNGYSDHFPVYVNLVKEIK
jgi:predicted extracellular nuclease